MTILTIFNTTICTIIVLRWLHQNNRILIHLNRTVWCNKLYGISIHWANQPKWARDMYGSYSSTRILYIPIRNYKKMNEWDHAQFKNGEYHKYRKKTTA